MEFRTIISLVIGGFLGAISRTALASLVVLNTETIVPLGTLTVNLLGSMGLAFILSWKMDRIALPEHVKLGIATGFFGSFTTFSTISLETINLLEQWGVYWWLSYEALNISGGLGMAALGFYLAKALEKKFPERGDGQC